MDLTLSVIRYRDHLPDQPLTASITELGGRIGRSPDNDLVLPDVDCWVSGHHADVRFREGKFLITDTSTNGTYLNEAPDRLPAGEIQLHDGDKLTIGAYLLRVDIAASDPPAQSATIGDALLWDGMEDETPVAFGPAPSDLQDPLSPGPEAAGPPIHQAPDAEIRVLPDGAGPTTLGSEAAQARADRDAKEMSEPVLAPGPQSAHQPIPASESIAASFDPQRQYLAAFKAFAEGLGGPELPEDPEAQAHIMRTTGILLRTFTEGLMTLLITRAGFKSEMRLAVTRIQTTGNNPFKLCVDVDDVLSYLLLQPRRGFLPPVDAARQALKDVGAHEAAMAAGVQAVLEALLARFEPVGIECLLAKQARVKTLLPTAKKAKRWDLLKKVHADLAGETADGLLTLFREDFSRAYEKRLQEIKTSQGKRRH